MNRYQPKKCKDPVKAIREHCIECMGGRENGGYLKLVRECVSPHCPTYEFRLGKNPYRKQKLTVPLSPRASYLISGCFDNHFHVESPSSSYAKLARFLF